MKNTVTTNEGQFVIVAINVQSESKIKSKKKLGFVISFYPNIFKTEFETLQIIEYHQNLFREKIHELMKKDVVRYLSFDLLNDFNYSLHLGNNDLNEIGVINICQKFMLQSNKS